MDARYDLIPASQPASIVTIQSTPPTVPLHPAQGSAPAVETRDPFQIIGTTIAQKYAIESLLGEGGYGVVYAAQHLLIKKSVAVKCMKPLGTTTEDTARATALFMREAQVLFSVSHPGIVRFYDVGTLTAGFHHEVPYAVLERVDGRSLAEDITARTAEHRPYTRAEIRQLFTGVLDALAFTHDAAVAHRDLKPSNIMLVAADDSPVQTGASFRTKILDFGVARFVEAQSGNRKHTAAGGMTGFTPAYAAPEQWTDGLGEPGPATDVFSVALTLAEACTFRTVIDARTPAQIFGVVMAGGRKADILTGRTDLPPILQLVIDRALQVHPSIRYANAREMLADVVSAFDHGTVSEATKRIASSADAPATVSVIAPVSPLVPLAPLTPSPNPYHPTLGAPNVSSTFPSNVAHQISAAPAPLPAPLLSSPPKQKSGHGVMIGAIAAASIVMFGGGLFGGSVLTKRRAARPIPPAPVSSVAIASSSPIATTTTMLTAVSTPTGSQYTPAQIASSMGAANDDFLLCQKTAVARGAPAVADVMLFVAIHPSGFVWTVLDMGTIDPLATKPLEQEHVTATRWANLCMTGIASALRFPAHDKDDLAGTVIKLRFRPNVPDETPAADATTQVFASSWIKDKPRTPYPSYDMTVKTQGRLITYDYKDGVGVCLSYDSSVRCRWVQIDSSGRATFERKADGTIYDGRWGFGEDDTSAGSWKLTLKREKSK